MNNQTEFEKVEKELVEELNKRGLELKGADAEMTAEYIIEARYADPTYNVNQYITDTLKNYPKMLVEQ